MKTNERKKGLKNIYVTIIISAFTLTIMSCSNQPQSDKDIESFKSFLSEVQVKTEDEVEDSWASIEKEYNKQVEHIDQKKDDLSEEMKEEYEDLKNDYMEIKVKYEAMNDEDEMMSTRMEILYATLLTNEGDMNLTGVHADNIESVYTGFVDIVDTHKDDYTREDWDEVDVLWDALNKRKNELEDQLTSDQKMSIGEEKVKYGTCKAMNKLPAKSKEKQSVE